MPKSRWLAFAGLALGGCSLDLATKHWVFGHLGMPGEGGNIPIVGRLLTLETHLNEGALFGMGQGQIPVFVAMSLVAAVFVVVWLFGYRAAHDWALTIALGCVSAGIGGNLYDRLGVPGLAWNYPPARIGAPVYAVRDWIHFQVPGWFDFPVFNLADSLLVCGATVLICHALFARGEGHLQPRPASVPSTP